MYMTQVTNRDGSRGRHCAEHGNAVEAAQAAKAKFPNAAHIDAETYAAWRARAAASDQVQHDTEKLPCNGFYFAPGVEASLTPRHIWGFRPGSALGRFAWGAIKVLAIGGVIGAAAGYLQAKGWPL